MGKFKKTFQRGVVDANIASTRFCSLHNQKSGRDIKCRNIKRKDIEYYISSFLITAGYWSLNGVFILTATMGTAFANSYENKLNNKSGNKSPQKSCMDVSCNFSTKDFWVADNSNHVSDVLNKYPAIFHITLPEVTEVESKVENKNNLDERQTESNRGQEKLNDSSRNITKSQTSLKQRNLSQNKAQQTNPQQTKPQQTNPQQNNPEQNNRKKQEKQIKLSISDVVFLVVANNTDIKNAFLNRINDKQDLAVAEDEFVPNLTPRLSLDLNEFGGNRDLRSTATAGARLQVRIPTGAELSFDWTGDAEISGGNNLSGGTNDDFFRQTFAVSLTQPILRGAGIKLNRASIEIARLEEEANIIDLKSELINTISEAITAYRALIQAQEALEIQRVTLKNAQESLEVTQALIDAGRVAPVDIIQNEANVARLRVALLDAENQLESRKVALLNILDIDKNTNIAPGEIPEVEKATLNLEKLRQIALANRPDYLRSKIEVSQNKLELLEAKDERRWELNLTAGLENRTGQESDARAGLSLSREIGNLSLRQQFERARVTLLQSENTLQDRLTTLDLELQDNVRNVNLSFSQLELARNATRLSQQQLEIEEERRRLGRDVTILDLIRLQEDLAQARVDELNATIGYLNALTDLDQFLGTTLQTWQINVENRESETKD